MRSLLHPGLWFSISWASAIISYWAIDAANGVPVYDDVLLAQLMTYILIICFVFFFLTFVGARRLNDAPTLPAFFHDSNTPYGFFCAAALLGSLINWAYLGAQLSYNDEIRQQWLYSIPKITARMWYLFVLSFPASILAGRFFMIDILKKKPLFSLRTLYWFLPAISGVFWSLGTGGRQTIGLLLLAFAIGAASGLAGAARAGFSISSRSLVKFFAAALATFLLFGLFVGMTGLARAEQQGTVASSFDDIWYLAPIGQLVSYNGLSLATYQAYGDPRPRDLSETGPVSLGGLQRFGLKYITGWRPLTVDDTNPERAFASRGLPLASGTRNIFYDFQADFGVGGAIVVSVILALISHLLFLRLGSLNEVTLTASTPHVIAIMFWGYSHQFSLLIFDTFFWLVASCALWDLAMALFWRNRARAVVKSPVRARFDTL